MEDTHRESPLFHFGVVADVQYADIDDQLDSTGRYVRHYRQSLEGLQQAVNSWNNLPDDMSISFLLQLGDIIDGKNHALQQSQVALDRTLEVLDSFRGDIHHTWGNHELYNFSRKFLLNSPLNSSPREQRREKNGCYYGFSPHPDFLFVMLDTYTVSMLGVEDTDPEYLSSRLFLESKNPNVRLNDPNGLQGLMRRYCNYNGRVDEEQLAWLDATLQVAQHQGQKVVVAGHQLLMSETSEGWDAVLWNFDEVLAVFHKYDCVLAYLCGHDHNGRQMRDSHGIVHLTVPGVIEGTPGNPDFGTVHVYKNRMEVQGHGRLPTMTLTSWKTS